jgi:RNA polymerase sigma-70 factor (ECF subfamily)
MDACRSVSEPEADEALVGLMIEYQAGGLAAFEALYAALHGPLRGYFGATARDGALVLDLVQDTFLQIHRSRRSYQPPLPVRPWVFGVARNVLRRHRRTAWRTSRRELAVLGGIDGPAPPPARAGGVEARDVHEALHRLPAGRREAWVLHHVQGLSFQEVAERLRIGVAAAKLRSSRGMKSLRAALGIDPGGNDD